MDEETNAAVATARPRKPWIYAGLALVAALALGWLGIAQPWRATIDRIDAEDLARGDGVAMLTDVIADDGIDMLREKAAAGMPAATLLLGFCHVTGHDACGYDPAKAIAQFEIAQAAGVPRAEAYLCEMHRDGTGVERDLDRAYELCSAADKAGDWAGRATAVEMNARQQRRDIAPAEAEEMLKRQAEEGSAPAMLRLSALYRSGVYGPGKEDEAPGWARRAVEAGSAEAVLHLAFIDHKAADGAVAKAGALQPLDTPEMLAFPANKAWLGHMLIQSDNEDRGAGLVTEALETGHPVARTIAAYAYRDGTGFPQDTAKASQLAREAIADGYLSAAQLLMPASDTPDSEKLELLRLIATQGTHHAEMFSAFGLIDRPSLARADRDLVRTLLLRNAERGYNDAMVELATLSRSGKHIGKDLARARRWFGEAHMQGAQQAALPYADMLIYGEGGDRDLDRAIGVLAGISGEEAQTKLARTYTSRAGEGDFDRALAIAERQIKAGIVDGHMIAGSIYKRTQYAGKDLARAKRHFVEAMMKGDESQRRIAGRSFQEVVITENSERRAAERTRIAQIRDNAPYSERSCQATMNGVRCGYAADTCRVSTDGRRVACGGLATTCRVSTYGRDVACGGKATTCRVSTYGRDVACGGLATTCRVSTYGRDVACGGLATTCRVSTYGNDVACGGLATSCRASTDGRRVACGGETTSCRSAYPSGQRVCGRKGYYSGD